MAESTTLTTPRPVYTEAPPITGPDLRERTESGRIGAAISAARRLYPDAVAAVLVDALTFHQATTARVNPSSMPARLVDELLRPPA